MRLQTKIMLLFCSSVLFVGITIGLFYSVNSTKMIKETFGTQAKKISELAAKQINPAAFEAVVNKINPDDPDSKSVQQRILAMPEYNRIREKLLLIKELTGVKYLYTMAKLNNNYIYVVDGEELSAPSIVWPGRPEPEVHANLKAVFETQQTQVGDLTFDKEWGALLTSYVPLWNHEHQLIGVIGADFNGSQIYAVLQRNYQIGLGILVIGLLITILGSFFISRFISVPVMNLAAVAEKLAAGNVDITLRPGAKDEIGQLTRSFAKMIETIKEQANAAAKIAIGDPTINLREKSENDILSKNLNLAVQNIMEQSRAAEKIASGNLDVALQVKSDRDILSKSINRVAATLHELIEAMASMSREHDAGDIDVFIAEEKFEGSFRSVAKGVNDMVKGHISVKKKAMACVAEFAKGNFNAELEKFPGKKAFINDHIESLRKNLKDVSATIHHLIEASREGRLSERVSTAEFQGDWEALIKGLNGLLDAVIEPIREAAGVLDEMSKGNLQIAVNGNYQGDHAKIKDSLNATLESLNP